MHAWRVSASTSSLPHSSASARAAAAKSAEGGAPRTGDVAGHSTPWHKARCRGVATCARTACILRSSASEPHGASSSHSSRASAAVRSASRRTRRSAAASAAMSCPARAATVAATAPSACAGGSCSRVCRASALLNSWKTSREMQSPWNAASSVAAAIPSQGSSRRSGLAIKLAPAGKARHNSVRRCSTSPSAPDALPVSTMAPASSRRVSIGQSAIVAATVSASLPHRSSGALSPPPMLTSMHAGSSANPSYTGQIRARRPSSSTTPVESPQPASAAQPGSNGATARTCSSAKRC
eukprot:scaffold165990_cov28-Tisochrysis_lutea.AAC.3